MKNIVNDYSNFTQINAIIKTCRTIKMIQLKHVDIIYDHKLSEFKNNR